MKRKCQKGKVSDKSVPHKFLQFEGSEKGSSHQSMSRETIVALLNAFEENQVSSQSLALHKFGCELEVRDIQGYLQGAIAMKLSPERVLEALFEIAGDSKNESEDLRRAKAKMYEYMCMMVRLVSQEPNWGDVVFTEKDEGEVEPAGPLEYGSTDEYLSQIEKFHD